MRREYTREEDTNWFGEEIKRRWEENKYEGHKPSWEEETRWGDTNWDEKKWDQKNRQDDETQIDMRKMRREE